MAVTAKKPTIDKNLLDDVSPVVDESPDERKKREKLEKRNEKKLKGKKSKSKRIIRIAIVLFIIGFIIGILFFNLFNIRNKYLNPILSKIPIVNNIVETDTNDSQSELTNEELIDKTKTLETELATKNAEIEQLEKMQDIDMAEIARLQKIEEQQLKFETDKEEFDRLIALNDPTAYTKFYENIAPENAEELYKDAITVSNQSKEFKKYIATVSAMDEGEAAKSLEELMLTDMDLVILIFKNIDADKGGAILNNMAPENSAVVINQMVPA